jgi:hypothetical protein
LKNYERLMFTHLADLAAGHAILAWAVRTRGVLYSKTAWSGQTWMCRDTLVASVHFFSPSSGCGHCFKVLPITLDLSTYLTALVQANTQSTLQLLARPLTRLAMTRIIRSRI